MSDFDRINYCTSRYNFLEIVKNWFEIGRILPREGISNLHYHKSYNLFERENDQSTIWHECFYKMIVKDNSFNKIYVKFLAEKIKPRYQEKIVFQKIPTFRVHLPNNVSVGEFHKDKHYRSENWADEVKELNYFLPLTKAYKTNTIWAETKEDKGDFKAIESDYGQCVEWSATNLTHGNKKNITGKTRVSFDFRIIPKSRFLESNHLSINTKIPFSIGGYYDVL
tara:strand:- start:8140 stop:8811 length:672 start_codon:yes stop_codon:yes gene_type:complete